MAVKTCAFVACTCPVEGEDAYCCAACRELGAEGPETRAVCTCGHLDCANERRLQADVDEKSKKIQARPDETE